jgi:hypothetical protein
MTKDLALDIIGGGFSYPSKMPCPSYSIPAQLCKTGGKLREVAGSVCSKCYALKNTYLFPAVRKAMAKRLASIRSPLWPSAMAYLIKAEGNRFFRWHDSGDLQNVGHLKKIIKVCELTPEVRHWLPTREYGIVQKYKENGGGIPENLTIRLSGHMIDGKLPENLAERLGCVVSAVVSSSATCPSKNQGNQCVDCRACWDKSIKIVSYQKH